MSNTKFYGAAPRAHLQPPTIGSRRADILVRSKAQIPDGAGLFNRLFEIREPGTIRILLRTRMSALRPSAKAAPHFAHFRTYHHALLSVGCLVALAATLSLQAQTNYQRTLSFGPTSMSGSSPRGALIEASDGWLYGMTYAGGTNNLGTVFRISKNGSGFKSLWSFSGPDFPFGGVIEGTNGMLYGMSSGGGDFNGGTVFRINKDGTGFQVVRSFNPANQDGVAPVATLLQGRDGLLYGTCSGGGSNNLGTVFKLSADGTVYSILHHFAGSTNGADGSAPGAGLMQGLDGALYSTTQKGGNNDLGTVFKLDVNGTDYTVLHRFAGAPSDGRVPLAGLVLGPDGLLYGTTQYGGSDEVGTIFKVDTNGNNYAIVKSFATGAGGNEPLAALSVGGDGALYGTAFYGGANDGGVAFRIDPTNATYTVLHDFLGTGGDGAQPFAALLRGSDGAWYGNTFYGGAYPSRLGVLFRLFSGNAPISITSISNLPTAVFLSFSGGAAGQPYIIQAAASLSPASWQNIGTNTAAIDGTFQFTDSAGPVSSTRFYRTAVP